MREIPWSPITGLLLDLDNTLYDYNKAHQPALREVVQFLSQKTGVVKEDIEKEYGVARGMIHQQLKGKASSHNRLLYFQKLLENINKPIMPYALEAYDLYWDVFIEHIVLFDEVMSFLEKNQDKRICILTDLTADIQHKKLHKLGLSSYIHALVTSEEVGVEKPDRGMFECGLKKLGCMKEEVCMIGDNYEKDVMGAVELGMKAIWVNKEGGERRERALVVEVEDLNFSLMSSPLSRGRQ